MEVVAYRILYNNNCAGIWRDGPPPEADIAYAEREGHKIQLAYNPQQEQSGEDANIACVIVTESGNAKAFLNKSALSLPAGIYECYTSPATPTATASQESAPGEEAVRFIDVWKKYMPAPMPEELQTYRWCETFWKEGRKSATPTPTSDQALAQEAVWKEARELANDIADSFDGKRQHARATGAMRVVHAINDRLNSATATASQESAFVQKVAAINFIMDDGTHKVVAQRQLPQHAKLYLAPPTSMAIAAMVIKQAAEILDSNMFEYTCKAGITKESMKAEILSLTPANAEAELEALMMKVAESVSQSTSWVCATSSDEEISELRAIVRRVLDERK